MDFDLKKEQETLQTAATRFAQNALRDVLAGDKSEFPLDAWRRCTDYGLQAMPLPYEYGGGGHDLLTMMAVMEGFAYGCQDSRFVFAVNNHLWRACLPVFFSATEEQKREYMPRLCRGALIGTGAWRDADADGGDVTDVRMTAVEDGDALVLSGVKVGVCCADVADLFVVHVLTLREGVGDEEDTEELTAFLVPRTTKGLSVEGDYIGADGVPFAGKLVFDGCRLSREDMLGPVGRGAAVFRCSMEWETGCCLSAGLGMMAAQVDRCYGAVRDACRAEAGSVRSAELVERLVKMRIRQEAARPMVYRIGWVKQKNRYAHAEAHAARLFMADVFLRNTRAEEAILGGSALGGPGTERKFADTVGGTMHAAACAASTHFIAESIGLC